MAHDFSMQEKNGLQNPILPSIGDYVEKKLGWTETIWALYILSDVVERKMEVLASYSREKT